MSQLDEIEQQKSTQAAKWCNIHHTREEGMWYALVVIPYTELGSAHYNERGANLTIRL